VVAVALEFGLTSASFGSHAHVVSVSGDLDASTASRLREELDRASEDGAAEIVVDLLEVPFVDSVALGILVEASKRTQARGGIFKVVCNDHRVAWIIEIIGFDRIHTTVRAALESPGKAAGTAARNSF
jgi:anti-sigma B factor antagonist